MERTSPYLYSRVVDLDREASWCWKMSSNRIGTPHPSLVGDTSTGYVISSSAGGSHRSHPDSSFGPTSTFETFNNIATLPPSDSVVGGWRLYKRTAYVSIEDDYFVHETQHIVADIDLRNRETLNSLMEYFYHHLREDLRLRGPGWDLWIKARPPGNGNEEIYVWVQHAERIVRRSRSETVGKDGLSHRLSKDEGWFRARHAICSS